MKIVVDRTRCTAIGICEGLAPDRFEVGDDGEMVVLGEDVSPADRQLIEEVVNSCPTQSLRLEP